MKLFDALEQEYGLPSGTMTGISEAETGHIKDENKRILAKSPKGALGIYQIMPATAKELGVDPRDPVQSAEGSARYLSQLLQSVGGDPIKMAAAYNAGLGNVKKYGGVPDFKETKGYVERFQKHLQPAQSKRMTLADIGMTPDEIMAQLTGSPVQSAPEAGPAGAQAGQAVSGTEGLSPEAQTAIRSTAKGLLSPVMPFLDAPSAAYNLAAKGVNALRPGTMDYVSSATDWANYGLEQAGIDPNAQSTPERLVTSALGAASGVGAGKGIAESALPALAGFGKSMATNGGRQILAALGGTSGVEIAQEAGAGPVGQALAGVAGGIAGGSVGGIASGIGSTVKRSLKPVTPMGREEIAGRVLTRQATDAERAMSRATNPTFAGELVQGSKPTLAEAAQDPGLARLQRVLTSSQQSLDAGVDQVNATRLAQQDESIRKLMDSVNRIPSSGKADAIDILESHKNNIFNSFKQGAGRDADSLAVNPAPVENALDSLAKSAVGDTNITKMLGGLRSTLKESPLGEGQPPTFTQLWNMRKELDNRIFESWATSTGATKQDLKRVGMELRNAMNASLVEAVPEFKPFLRQYSRSTQAQQRLEFGREIVDKSENAARHAAGDADLFGARAISGAKLENLAKNIDKSTASAGVKLSKSQREAIDAIRNEKARANILTTGGAPVNSATAQNLSVNNLIADDIISGLLGDKASKGTEGLRTILQAAIGRPAQFALRGASNDIMRLVAQGLIDPQEGARLMRMAPMQSAPTIRGILENTGKSGVLGQYYNQGNR